jgi:succinoglycan biosynthesis protein ExoV
MRLQWFRGGRPNFGDELNAWMWPRLLPDFFDDDPRVLFLGIGSIIGTQYDTAARKVVFGAGYVSAYHDRVPDVRGPDWDVFFVRGPRTARALGLPDNVGIGDAAILVRALGLARRPVPGRVGFMPHWESLPRGNWQAACERAGVWLIDPSSPVNEVLDAILGCELLLSEAMHGVIVADALRVPWIPLLPIDAQHRDKWLDWAESLHVPLRFRRLWPSTLTEAQIAAARSPVLSRLVGAANQKPLTRLAAPLVTRAAARRLTILARETPCLSADKLLDDAAGRMIEQLALLQAKYGKGGGRA